jgi:glycine betaine catabolism B
MAQPSFKTALTAAIPQAPGTMSFRFERPAGFEYVAGQWFVLTLERSRGAAAPGPEPVTEPLVSHFTFSSSPTEPFLELTTRLSSSEFKTALLALSPGDLVEMEGPYGTFTLRDEALPMACLIGGIGVTPLRSWLRYLDDSGGRRTMVVFYGSMTEEGIVFRQELEAIAARIPTIRIIHVLANPEEGWTGHRGFITADTIHAELADPLAWTYFVCGPPPMIAAMRPVLAELEVPRAQQVFESFQGYQS